MVRVNRETTINELNNIELLKVLNIGGKKNPISLQELRKIINEKLCIKCKHQIGNFYYRCSECGGFYCIHCPNYMDEQKISCLYCGTRLNTSQNREKINYIKENLNTIKKPDESHIIYYAEKKECLICSDKIKEFTYMCSNCKATYCESCVRAFNEEKVPCIGCDTKIELYPLDLD